MELGNVYLTGDMNLHGRGETDFIYASGFEDVFLRYKVKPADEGYYTWDSERNPLINLLLPFDNRRMRLDRIAKRTVNHVPEKQMPKVAGFFNPKQMNVTFTGPVARSALLGWKLCLSDHFGLQALLKFEPNPSSGPDYKLLRNDLFEGGQVGETGFRTIKEIIIMRIFVLTLVSVLIYFGIRCLF